ncbi:hypothetical protein SI90_01835 [Akkermansia muciniphila]|nr:hypothetical protein CXU07_06135 [Akkermansia muciniphila]PNC72423.1 hypothetical protein CXU05_04395 [Akkermansia muciniphila]QAA59992.1 hypothetical protein C1O57_07520 [Akkermansia muciniphila]QAR49501.1 hypothetical protein SI90_01835 [Akkermansia muciniphila]
MVVVRRSDPIFKANIPFISRKRAFFPEANPIENVFLVPFGTFGDGQYNVILYHDKSFIHLFLNILSVPFSPLLSKLHFGLPGSLFLPVQQFSTYGG